jgi:lipopolysaccharide export system protein LptC
VAPRRKPSTPPPTALGRPVYSTDRWLLIAVLLGLLAGLTQWLIWLRADDGERDEFVGPSRSDYTLSSFAMTQLDDRGRLSFTVTAPRLARNDVVGDFVIDEPRFRLRDGGGGEWDAKSATGWIRADAKQLRLEGEVLVERKPKGDDGPIEVRTDRITASMETSTLTSDSAVTIVRPGSILRGTGLDADLTKRRFTLLSAVTATFQPNAQP